MIGAKIRCDHCGFVGEMEMVPVSKSTVTAPHGWGNGLGNGQDQGGQGNGS